MLLFCETSNGTKGSRFPSIAIFVSSGIALAADFGAAVFEAAVSLRFKAFEALVGFVGFALAAGLATVPCAGLIAAGEVVAFGAEDADLAGTELALAWVAGCDFVGVVPCPRVPDATEMNTATAVNSIPDVFANLIVVAYRFAAD